MNVRSRASLIAAGCLLASSIGAAPAVAGDRGQRELAEVRRATAVYHNVDAAIEAGYTPTDECVPGMGYHFVNFAQIGKLDPLVPDVLIYAANRSGTLRLVGVEWLKMDEDGVLATDEDRPSMFGREFDGPMPGHEPSMRAEDVHYDLHAYIWQGNPDGVLEPWNPNITCPAH